MTSKLSQVKYQFGQFEDSFKKNNCFIFLELQLLIFLLRSNRSFKETGLKSKKLQSISNT